MKTDSGAVITIDSKAYHNAKKRKAEKNRLNELENKMDRVEALLIQLVNK